MPLFLKKGTSADTSQLLMSTFRFPKLSDQSEFVSHYLFWHSLFPLGCSLWFPGVAGKALGLQGSDKCCQIRIPFATAEIICCFTYLHILPFSSRISSAAIKGNEIIFKNVKSPAPMSPPRPFQLYHFRENRIGKDGPFKPLPQRLQPNSLPSMPRLKLGVFNLI